MIDPGGGVLHLAAQRGDAAAVKWLLAHGANVNGRWDAGGADVTPLHLAASRGQAEVVRLLLRAGPDSAIWSCGIVAFLGPPGCYRMLSDDGLSTGADISHRDLQQNQHVSLAYPPTSSSTASFLKHPAVRPGGSRRGLPAETVHR